MKKDIFFSLCSFVTYWARGNICCLGNLQIFHPLFSVHMHRQFHRRFSTDVVVCKVFEVNSKESFFYGQLAYEFVAGMAERKAVIW